MKPDSMLEGTELATVYQCRKGIHFAETTGEHGPGIDFPLISEIDEVLPPITKSGL